MTDLLIGAFLLLGIVLTSLVGVWLSKRRVGLFEQGRWRCAPCDVTWRGTVPVGRSIKHDCGRKMVRTNGDD